MPDVIPRSQFQNAEWLLNNSFPSYIPSNQDLTGATYQYYGFVKQSGAWYIQRFKIDVSNIIIYTYARGNTFATYDANWNASGAYVGSLSFVSFPNLSA